MVGNHPQTQISGGYNFWGITITTGYSAQTPQTAYVPLTFPTTDGTRVVSVEHRDIDMRLVELPFPAPLSWRIEPIPEQQREALCDDRRPARVLAAARGRRPLRARPGRSSKRARHGIVS